MKLKYAVYIFIAFFLTAALTLAAAVFFMERAGRLSERTASIALPNEGGYVEAWTPYLSQIARTVDVPELTIKTYTTYTELEELFNNADKLNLLWAEVPLSAQFPVNRLYDEGLISAIDDSKNISHNYPNAINSAIQTHITNPKGTLYGLPISLNPLVQVYNPQTIEQDFDIELAVLGVSDQNFIASYTFLGTLIANNSTFPPKDILLESISKMSNDKSIQQNANTYTLHDAQLFFFNGNSRKLLLHCNELNDLSVEQRRSISIHSMGKHIASDITFAIFPHASTEKKQTAIQLSQNYLLIPEILFATANSRNWIPAHIGTVAKNVNTDFIRKQIRQANICTVPKAQGYYEKEQQDQFIADIKAALGSSIRK